MLSFSHLPAPRYSPPKTAKSLFRLSLLIRFVEKSSNATRRKKDWRLLVQFAKTFAAIVSHIFCTNTVIVGWTGSACVDVSAYARHSKQTQPVEKAHAEETIGAGLQRARCPGLSPLLNPEAKADPSIKESMSTAAGNSGITLVPKISVA